MYDGVVTPEFMDDYGQVQNGDYPGQGYGNRYVGQRSKVVKVTINHGLWFQHGL